MTRRTVLKTDNLGKVYHSGDRELTVLDGVTFALPWGSSCAIVGPSGSGKTTLLGLCAGLDRPTTGSVSLNGLRLNEQSEEQLAEMRGRDVGFVFQTFQLIPTLTAVENVMVPSELRGARNARRRAAELLSEVGLAERFDHYPAQLSGGEQQRVGLARAFINQPIILFADEPTGNLDAETSEQVSELLFALNRVTNTTLLLVTHNLELATRAQRTIRLRGGRIVGDTTIEPKIVASSSVRRASKHGA